LSNEVSTKNAAFGKANIALVCIAGMFAGFLVSRAALSMSMLLFGLNALRGVHPKEWLRQKWWLLGIGWVAIYALSWFWSEDKHNWGIRLDVKLPILLLPLAFALLPRFNQRQMQWLTLTVAALLAIAAAYSCSFLITDPAHYIYGYKQSHMLPTLPKQDHIRASTSIALFAVWSVYAWPALSKTAKWTLGIALVFLIAYIHILAAKSGLLSFYVFVGAYAVYLAFSKHKAAGLSLLIAIPLLFMVAIRYVPTLRERANYLEFTIFMMKQGDKTGLGDINRLMSYKAATNLIKEHPLTGVGTGDMMQEMTAEYKRLYPEAPPESVLLPHNQFLTVALGCGLIAMFIFTVWVLAPLKLLRKDRPSFFFFVTWLISLLQLMIEPALEVQLGVFIFLFFLLLMKNELPTGKAEQKIAN
jgi:O-antigen ligase